jgi:outer membrane protein
MKKKPILLLILSCFFVLTCSSQEKWDLKRCVEYAWANNISIKQQDIQTRIANVNLKQNKWSQYPSANFSTNTGFQWGRNIDPTTNLYTSSNLLFQGFNFQAGIDVFSFNKLRDNVLGAQFEADASQADLEKVKNDVALTVANYYLQALLAKQQVFVSKVQMQQSQNLLTVARKKVSAGAAPELDALSLEGQYANDSATYISAQATADQDVLILKAALNVDAAVPFDIATPPVDQIPIEPILELEPETVYQIALKNQPAQRANDLRLKSLTAYEKAARAALFPTISVGGGLSTNFANTDKATFVNFPGGLIADPSGGVVNVGGTQYPLLTPSYTITESKKTFGNLWQGWGDQMSNHFQQNLGFSISVPILNGGASKFTYERAKLNVKNLQLTQDLTNQTLKNNIYQAYYSASAALQKFNATKVAVAAAQKTYEFANKRHDLGLLNTFDLITSQNNLTKTTLDLLNAQFEYVFRIKVLEYYKGLGIRI